jgi:hypothetical protein
MLQKKLQLVEVVHVLSAEVEKSTDPIRGMSCVIVATPAVVNVAVSCGSGTRVDHVAVDHVAPDCQSVVTGVVNVIPVHPPQSPLFPVIPERFHDADHAPSMSWMSTLEAVTVVLTVRVTCVPFVVDCTRRRFVAEFQARVRTPEIVWLSVNVRVSVLVAVPVRVRVVNVLVPDTVVHVPLSWTMLYVLPHPQNIQLLVSIIVEVFALKVKFVDP